ncbi:MAG: M16 family metallopeptidase [Gemmatimonadaceae bacterium]
MTRALVLWCYLLAAPVAAQSISLPSEKYQLANGLEVILHEDRSVPMVAVNMYYKVGSADEKPGRTGFAHLFEHIMFMGSAHVPVGQFDQLLEAAGAANNGSTNEDRTDYNIEMPSNALPLALWLDADRLGWLLPTMDQSKLDVQRDVVKNERRQGVDNVPYGRAFETIAAALYPREHPYSWPVIGSMADLSAASLEDVTQFFRNYYVPNNAALVVAGDFDRDSVRGWVERNFGDIPRGAELPTRPTPSPVILARDTFLVLEDRVQLPRVYWTWPSAALFQPDDASLDLLAYILAGDKNSRLYKRLVYDLQLAQDVSAFQASSRLSSQFYVIATPKPGQTPAAIGTLVQEELTKLMRDGITPRELERARNTFRARKIDQLSSVRGKASLLNYYNYFAGTPNYAREDAERYDRVTRDDIHRVAHAYLAKPKVVLTVVPAGQTSLKVTGGSR